MSKTKKRQGKTFKLQKIPQESRLEKYLNELPNVIGKKKEALEFLKKVFLDCYNFVWENSGIIYMPKCTLKLALTYDSFKKEETKAMKAAVIRQEAKDPDASHAFVIGNKFSKAICIDVRALTELLRHNNLTFIMNLVETFMHELLHIAFPNSDEQKNFDMQNKFVEAFLGIELPSSRKKVRASDYYD